MTSLAKLVLGVAVVILLGGGIYLLREATMSTNYATGPDSRMIIQVRAASNRAEEGVVLEQLALAQMGVCALDVSRGHGTDVRRVAGTADRFVITLQPALDSTDRKQYRGCLEDWTVNHVQLHVLSMREEAGAGGDGGA